MLFFLTSCEEDVLTSGGLEELSPTEEIVSHSFQGIPFQLQDSRIKFDSEKELYAMVRAMVGDYDEAADFFTHLPNHQSSRAAYLELISDESLTAQDVEFHSPLLYSFERDGETYVDHTIDDLALEFLANAAGIFEAGRFVYDLSDRNHPVKIPAEAYVAKANVKTFERVEAAPIELYRLENSGFMKVDVRTCRTDFTAGGNNHRITGQLERSHIFGSDGNLWNFNVRTRFFRKRLGVWFGVQADDLRSNWDLWINLDSSGQGTLTPTRFQNSHIARDGDQQNTRFPIVEETTQNSVYMSNQIGLNRSENIATEDRTTARCNCGL